MTCRVKARLILEFESCTQAYSTAVKKLATRMDTMKRERYLALLKRADLARMSCERARAALESHTAAHGC